MFTTDKRRAVHKYKIIGIKQFNHAHNDYVKDNRSQHDDITLMSLDYLLSLCKSIQFNTNTP